MQSDGQLGISEVAETLNIGERSLFRYLADGVIEPVNGRGRGKKLLFRREDVDFLAEVLASGYGLKQLQPGEASRLAKQVLDSCDAATELIRHASDVVLDSLDRLYRTSKSEDVYRLLKSRGRDPRHA